MAYDYLSNEEEKRIYGIIQNERREIFNEVDAALDEATDKQDFKERLTDNLDTLSSQAMDVKKEILSIINVKSGCPPGTKEINGRCIKKYSKGHKDGRINPDEWRKNHVMNAPPTTMGWGSIPEEELHGKQLPEKKVK